MVEASHAQHAARERALQRAAPRLPVSRRGMALSALARAGTAALPAVARCVAAGMTVIAAERAILSLVDGARRRLVTSDAPRRPTSEARTVIRSEITIVERVRYRR